MTQAEKEALKLFKLQENLNASFVEAIKTLITKVLQMEKIINERNNKTI